MKRHMEASMAHLLFKETEEPAFQGLLVLPHTFLYYLLLSPLHLHADDGPFPPTDQ